MDREEKEGEDKSQPRSIRDRRRPREKRRSTGVSFWTQDVRDFTSFTVISIRGTLHEVQEFITLAQPRVFLFDNLDSESRESCVTILSF